MCSAILPGAINAVPLAPKTTQPACHPLTSGLRSTGLYMAAAAGPSWWECCAWASVTPTPNHQHLLRQRRGKHYEWACELRAMHNLKAWASFYFDVILHHSWTTSLLSGTETKRSPLPSDKRLCFRSLSLWLCDWTAGKIERTNQGIMACYLLKKYKDEHALTEKRTCPCWSQTFTV